MKKGITMKYWNFCCCSLNWILPNIVSKLKPKNREFKKLSCCCKSLVS